MKVFDLNVVRRLRLPGDAIQLVLQYLQTPHPAAALIKSLEFERRNDRYGFPILCVRGVHMRKCFRLAEWNHPPLLHNLRIKYVLHRLDPYSVENFGFRPGDTFRFDPNDGSHQPHEYRTKSKQVRVKWPWGSATLMEQQEVMDMASNTRRCIKAIYKYDRYHFESKIRSQWGRFFYSDWDLRQP